MPASVDHSLDEQISITLGQIEAQEICTDCQLSDSGSDRLRSRFQESLVSYIVVPKVGHNTIQDSPGYWTLLNGD